MRSILRAAALVAVAASPLLTRPAGADAQVRPAPVASAAPRITVRFDNTPIVDVLSTFADFSNRSIVGGSGVRGTVTAEIRDQPWDVALRAILEAQGLRVVEAESGILLVEEFAGLGTRETVEPVITRVIRINYSPAQDLQTVVTSLLSERGTVGVMPSINALVVTDVPRVVAQVERLIRGTVGR